MKQNADDQRSLEEIHQRAHRTIWLLEGFGLFLSRSNESLIEHMEEVRASYLAWAEDARRPEFVRARDDPVKFGWLIAPSAHWVAASFVSRFLCSIWARASGRMYALESNLPDVVPSVADLPHLEASRFQDEKVAPFIESMLLSSDQDLAWLDSAMKQEFVRASSSANRANHSALFPKGVPNDPDIVDLVVRLNAEKEEPTANQRSYNEIARELTGETLHSDLKAQRLLARVRKLRKQGKVVL